MAIVKCENGHFFDNGKYEHCPYCLKLEHERNRYEEQIRDSVTIAMPRQESPQEVTMPLHEPVKGDDQKTVGIFSKQTGTDMVTGWLVCVRGREKGRDYRLHNGNNRIGRSYHMDVCVVEDPGISRESHATVVYDYKSNKFFLMPGNGTITMCNDQPVLRAVELKAKDRITLGESEFCFVPFCGEEYVWGREE